MSTKSKDVAILGASGAGKTSLCAALAKVSATKYGGNHVSFSTKSQSAVEINGPTHKYTLHDGAVSKKPELAVIVISAIEGGKSADTELVRAAKTAGCERFVAFINKCDLLGGDTEMLDLAEESVRDVFDSSGLDGQGIEVVRGSSTILFDNKNAKSQDSLVKLLEALEKISS
jgi:elongation factor Tu